MNVNLDLLILTLFSMKSLKLFLNLLLIFELLFSSTFGHREKNELSSSDQLEEVKELRHEIEGLKQRVQFLENEKINIQTDCEKRIIRLERNILKFNWTKNFEILNEDSKLAVGHGIVRASVNYTFPMYGNLHSTLGVYNNGYLWLDIYTTGIYIYIFNSEIDTTYGGSVTYRVSSKFEDLNLAQNLIERADPANEGIKLTSTLIVTYQNVTFFKSIETRVKCPETPRNTFQGILATDGVRSFVIFNFIELGWGGQIHGDPCTGDSSEIYAGFHDGFNSRLLNNTVGDNGFSNPHYKDLLTETNFGIPGVIVTRVDQRPIKMNQNAPFNYGEQFGDLKIPKSYDFETPVNFPLKFHGNQYSFTRIKTDGFIKFAENDDFPLIALYITGIKTRESGSIYYRVTSKNDELDLARVLIERIIPGEIKLTKLLIVTYHDVQFEKAANTTTLCPELALKNTFQGILATDVSSRSFIIFNYIDLNWYIDLNLIRIEDEKVCTGYTETFKVGFKDEFRTEFSFDNNIMMNNKSFSNLDLLTKSNIGLQGVFVTRIDEKPTKNFLKFNSTKKYGISCEDSKLEVGHGIVEASVNFPFNMFGKLHSTLRVDISGYLLFADQYIYIFNSKIDTTYGGTVTYRVSSKFEDLNLAQMLIERADPANVGLKLTSTFIVTYQNVPFFKTSSTLVKCPETPRNTFQCILATDGVRSFVIFNYISLGWGVQINGDPCTGYDSGIFAGFFDGFNNRLLNNTVGENGFSNLHYKDLLTETNIGTPGVIVTRVDQKSS